MVIAILVVMATAVNGKTSIFQSLFGSKSASHFLGDILSNVQKIIDNFKQRKVAKPTDLPPPVAAKPKFCKKRECPPFTVKNRTDVYELRCYEAAKWVSTKGQGDRKYCRERNFPNVFD